jgi:hypothetical protein
MQPTRCQREVGTFCYEGARTNVALIKREGVPRPDGLGPHSHLLDLVILEEHDGFGSLPIAQPEVEPRLFLVEDAAPLELAILRVTLLLRG